MEEEIREEIHNEEAPRDDELLKKIEALETENAEIRDKYLRLAAEFDNYKKRQSRLFGEMVDAAQDATILKILDILDNFERAIEANKDKSDPQKIIDGLHLIHKQILDMLELQGIEAICPEAGVFDPKLHEAVGSLPSDSAENSIIGVVCKGYRRGDRLLRPARVLVASPKSNEETTSH